MCGRYVIVLAGLVFACSKASIDPPPIDQDAYSGLRITVRHIYATQPAIQDSVLPGVAIELYRSEQDRTDRLEVYQQRVSDTSGQALFGRIQDDSYFILAIDDSLGSLEEEVSVSGGALEFLELLYLP